MSRPTRSALAVVAPPQVRAHERAAGQWTSRVFRRAASHGGHESMTDSRYIKSMTITTRQPTFERSAARGGFANLPPHVQVSKPSASHSILAEANEKNVSERDPAGRTAGRHGRWTEAL